MFGMVLQDTWLFSGTIMDNIRYGRLDATDEEVIAAAKAAHIHNFIMQQPGGYQMVLDVDNLMKGRTSFVIAHRLSTIKDADLILVMKDGDIIEQGNHEELLARKGFYADLYNSQFEKKEVQA